MKNVKSEEDYINLPAFVNQPPVAMLNWRTPPAVAPETADWLCERLVVMSRTEGLLATGLLATMVARRVQPLQR